MSRIQFRQKTEEELQAEAASRAKREPAARPAETVPSPAAPPPPVDAPSFALDGEPAASKPKKSRKKPGTAA